MLQDRTSGGNIEKKNNDDLEANIWLREERKNTELIFWKHVPSEFLNDIKIFSYWNLLLRLYWFFSVLFY